MLALSRRVLPVSSRVVAPLLTRSVSVSFTIKSFTDEYTTEEVKVTAEEGQTILAVAQENGASINSFCGGNCHCGGCQIKMTQAITDLIPRPSENEMNVLKKCVDVDESSRLACQVKVNKCMEGRIIVVPLAISLVCSNT